MARIPALIESGPGHGLQRGGVHGGVFNKDCRAALRVLQEKASRSSLGPVIAPEEVVLEEGLELVLGPVSLMT